MAGAHGPYRFNFLVDGLGTPTSLALACMQDIHNTNRYYVIAGWTVTLCASQDTIVSSLNQASMFSSWKNETCNFVTQKLLEMVNMVVTFQVLLSSIYTQNIPNTGYWWTVFTDLSAGACATLTGVFNWDLCQCVWAIKGNWVWPDVTVLPMTWRSRDSSALD